MSTTSTEEASSTEEPSTDEEYMTDEDTEHASKLAYHLSLLKLQDDDESDKSSTAPIFTGSLLRQTSILPSQYGILAGMKKTQRSGLFDFKDRGVEEDPRVFYNVTSPSSTFICGSQGSGKSHTLSCILEGCLMRSDAGRLLNPLTALVFHYDTFISETVGSPCEAAFLASHSGIKVRVLCAPTNLRSIQRSYSRFKIPVTPLQIDQADLNTKRMLDLMAVGQGDGSVPLYMHTVQRILRNMRLEQQETGSPFDYQVFKNRVMGADLLFYAPTTSTTVPALGGFGKKGRKAGRWGSDWKPEPSQLTIVDLSCPCISPDTACLLFNICFEIFMEQDAQVGRVVALHEAHKYMKSSVEAQTFTNTLLSTVRLQRHMAVRFLISTQEPTISSDLLSLCSVTIVHKFSSPAWLRALQGHVAAAAMGAEPGGKARGSNAEDSETIELSSKLSFLQDIVNLHVGEALLFAPGAIMGKDEEGSNGMRTLGVGYMLVKIRERLTDDGGKSVLSH